MKGKSKKKGGNNNNNSNATNNSGKSDSGQSESKGGNNGKSSQASSAPQNKKNNNNNGVGGGGGGEVHANEPVKVVEGEAYEDDETVIVSKEEAKKTSDNSANANTNTNTNSKASTNKDHHNVDAAALSKSEKNATLDTKLSHRPKKEELRHVGVSKDDKVSSSLQGVASTLEKKIASDNLDQRLQSRPQRNRLKSYMSSDEKISPSLQGTAQGLEKRINAQNVSHKLGHRPKLDDLTRKGVTSRRGSISDRIQNSQKHLEKQLTRDQVHHLLESRPGPEALHEYNVDVRGSVAPSLQGKRRSLEYQMTKDMIDRRLAHRPDPDQLEHAGILVSSDGQYRYSNDGGGGTFQEDNEASIARRARFAMALKCASRLYQLGMLDEQGKGNLKNLILNEDGRVAAAIEVFESDHDLEEMLDTMYRIAIA